MLKTFSTRDTGMALPIRHSELDGWSLDPIYYGQCVLEGKILLYNTLPLLLAMKKSLFQLCTSTIKALKSSKLYKPETCLLVNNTF